MPCSARRSFEELLEITKLMKEAQMSLAIWQPAMFFLGVIGMLLCFLFLEGCEKI